MIPSNFHTHTCFCDGRDTPEELVREAVSLHCPAIGFSGHSWVPFDDGYCMTPEKEKKYVETVLSLKEKYKDQITVYLGIEQDYYSAAPEYDYDYVIGSVHYVRKDGVYISVDTDPELLKRNVERFYGGDYYALAEDYYAAAADLFKKTGCNIIGHFDIVRKFNRGGCLFDTRDPRYVLAYTRALKALFASGCAFEINTRGSEDRTEFFPEPVIEALIRANGCRIVYSSDCHDRRRLITGLPKDHDNPGNIPRLAKHG